MQAIIQACVEASSPVIFRCRRARASTPTRPCSAIWLRAPSNMPRSWARTFDRSAPRPRQLVRAFARAASTWASRLDDRPVCLHLPYEENVALTKQVVDYAPVRRDGRSGWAYWPVWRTVSPSTTPADPKDVVDFVSKTGVDSLAISISLARRQSVQARTIAPATPRASSFCLNCVSDILVRESEGFRASPIVLHGSSTSSAGVRERSSTRTAVR